MYNKADRKPMSLREGRVFLDGDEIMDALTFEAVFTPDVVEHKRLGQRGKSRRYVGYDITGNISQYKSTPLFKQAVKKYIANGITPSFTITAVHDDPDSDYGKKYGKDTVTFIGVVFTGDIPLMNLDTEGELATQDIDFGASDVVL